MIFNKFFKRITKQDIIQRVEIFKDNHKEDYLLEEAMIDKKGKEVHLVVTYIENSEGYGVGIIHIFSNINKIERVMFNIEGRTLLIGDIQIFENRNRGIGSRVIDILEKVARQYNVSKIKGNLFSTDELNRERQIHFYMKNGFTIVTNTLEKKLKY